MHYVVGRETEFGKADCHPMIDAHTVPSDTLKEPQSPQDSNMLKGGFLRNQYVSNIYLRATHFAALMRIFR